MFGRPKVAPRSQELVFLDPDDDLGTIRSKLESSTAEEVYLVIPRRSPVLRTPLDFRILARVANELSSETILVTGDSARRRLAQHEGFRTRRSLRTLRHLMLGPEDRAPLLVLPDWFPSIPGLLVMVAGLLVVAAVAVVAIPQEKVTLVPQTTPVSREMDVLVDPTAQSADVNRIVLPGQLITQKMEIAGSLPVPGDRTVGKDRARGEIVLTDQRPDPVLVAKGTRVKTADGAAFTVDQDTRLQPNVPARVGITAVDPGTGGNVGAGAIAAFDGIDSSNLQVTNQRPTTGGTDRQAKLVTEDDQKALHDQLLQKAKDQGLTQIKQRAGQDHSVPDQSLQVKVDSEQYDQQPGTEADQLTGRLTVEASATAFLNQSFDDLVSNVLVAGAGQDMRLSGRPTVSTPEVVSVNGNQVKLHTKGSGVAVRSLDDKKIATDLRGMTLPEARTYLSRISGLAEPPQVDLTPSWAPRAFLGIQVSVLGPK